MYAYTHMEISRLQQPCSRVVTTLRGCSNYACDKLALLFTRCTQPCEGCIQLYIIHIDPDRLAEVERLCETHSFT